MAGTSRERTLLCFLLSTSSGVADTPRLWHYISISSAGFLTERP